jgi:hypothetical protein
MRILLGGAYQGKLDYAIHNYEITSDDVFKCTGAELDFSKKCIDNIERFALACVREGTEPLNYIKENFHRLKNSVIICDDIFCGVVPVQEDLRAWREATGRMMNWLTPQADSVVRMFCGLPQVLK